ncbi:MAG: S8 family serine peptidase [Phycisphaerae bacterium]|jgi:subtilisin family serine protease
MVRYRPRSRRVGIVFDAQTLLVSVSFIAAAVSVPAGERSAAGEQSFRSVSYEGKVHESVLRRFGEVGDTEAVKLWVFFTDKAVSTEKAYEHALQDLTANADSSMLKRRAMRRTAPGLFDFHDIPVAPAYIDAVERTGAMTHVTSRWLNAISVWATRQQVEKIARLPFVRSVQAVHRGRRVEPVDATFLAPKVTLTKGARPAPPDFYGQAEPQLTQINLIALHDLGFTGDGVVIGALDSGFHREHPVFNHPSHTVNVVAEYDFVDDDGDTSIEPGDTQGDHGTWVLSIMGGYLPDEYVGAAYDASFILCKTENDASETPAEEDNFVAGLEFIEANGGDVATSSLDYPSFYAPWQMDGRTAIITQAVNIATMNGVYCLNSTGNYNHDEDPNTTTIAEPNDAFQVISVGSVDLNGNMANSSSDGPTADGRVKPEVLARGVNTLAADTYTGYRNVSGTSFAVPLVAGAVACLAQAHPTWTVDQMRTYLMRSGDYYRANETFEPTYVRGYGIVDAVLAHEGDCNDNGIDDETDIAGATSTDCDENGVPDECFMRDCNESTAADACDILDGGSSDDDANGIPDECECPQLTVPLPPPDPVTRNRYLSFSAANPGRRTAVRVRLTEMPDAFQAFEGLTMWVDNPSPVSEIPGLTDTTPPVSQVARLTCQPVVRDWGSDGLVHVFDDEVVPGGTYQIQEIEVGCGDFLGGDTGFAEPFTVITPEWGDVVAPFAAPGLDQPDFVDITTIVDKFKNESGAPSKAVVDLSPDLPNQVIDFNDIVDAVDAFRGFTYPYDGPAGCQ